MDRSQSFDQQAPPGDSSPHRHRRRGLRFSATTAEAFQGEVQRTAQEVGHRQHQSQSDAEQRTVRTELENPRDIHEALSPEAIHTLQRTHEYPVRDLYDQTIGWYPVARGGDPSSFRYAYVDSQDPTSTLHFTDGPHLPYQSPNWVLFYTDPDPRRVDVRHG